MTKMLSATRFRNPAIGMVAVIRCYSNGQVTFTGYDAAFGIPVEAKQFASKADAFAYAGRSKFDAIA